MYSVAVGGSARCNGFRGPTVADDGRNIGLVIVGTVMRDSVLVGLPCKCLHVTFVTSNGFVVLGATEPSTLNDRTSNESTVGRASKLPIV